MRTTTTILFCFSPALPCIYLLYVHRVPTGGLVRLVGLALRDPGVNLGLELGVGDNVLILEPARVSLQWQTGRNRMTHGMLLKGSNSFDRSTARIVLRSITTRDMGRMTGSFITVAR